MANTPSIIVKHYSTLLFHNYKYYCDWIKLPRKQLCNSQTTVKWAKMETFAVRDYVKVNFFWPVNNFNSCRACDILFLKTIEIAREKYASKVWTLKSGITLNEITRLIAYCKYSVKLVQSHARSPLWPAVAFIVSHNNMLLCDVSLRAISANLFNLVAKSLRNSYNATQANDKSLIVVIKLTYSLCYLHNTYHNFFRRFES